MTDEDLILVARTTRHPVQAGVAQQLAARLAHWRELAISAFVAGLAAGWLTAFIVLSVLGR